ncbi:MAG: thioredoxin family protein [Acidobacteriota bacterium]|nr:thioredoxin family protein [Acidobacteriota bacterium]
MQNYIEKAMTFDEYNRLIDTVVAQGKTTGPNQNEELSEYTKLNQARMRRLFRTTELNKSLLDAVRNLKVNWIWLILTEAWCGDAAQNIPTIEKIARENDRIRTLYLLRDENLDLMDKYLTNGARAIPKLVCLDAETLEEIGTWGSRPQAAYDLFYNLKEQGLEKSEIIEKIHRWYIENDTKSLQAEFETLLQNWANKNE